MTLKQGGNLNTDSVATTTTVEINDATATTLVVARPLRTYLVISLDQGTSDIEVFIRLYAAGTDNIKKGILLTRRLSGNDALFQSQFVIDSSTIYTGEISAISVSGTFDLHITEF